jgi:hypothetical protein
MAFNAALHKLDGVPMQFWCLTAVASLWVAVGTGAFECAVKTISVASRPLNILHMGLISDVEVCCWLLVSHWCWAMRILDSIWLKVWHFASKAGPKLIPFAALKPYQLPPDH